MALAPIHMIDLKALMGDASDNIPGVPGIGEKTAMDLVQKYGSIDALYAKMPEVEAKPAALKKLQAGEESARHSYCWPHCHRCAAGVPAGGEPGPGARRSGLSAVFAPGVYEAH